MKLYTIGYEHAGQLALLRTLAEHGVQKLIDVRDLPNSRQAGFSKKALAASLGAEGISYAHLRALGTPKEGRQANRRRDWATFWGIVDAQLATPQAVEAFADAASMARAAPSCLLCLEADHTHCHRARVADELARRYGFTVEHLRVEGLSIV